ncbi:MAG: hypothetical protein HY300_17625 [Verrucomicrobia bacterium]|nr:hypothetical protein [Verrucomicrobiota bacterium]
MKRRRSRAGQPAVLKESKFPRPALTLAVFAFAASLFHHAASGAESTTPQGELTYVKAATREATIKATLDASAKQLVQFRAGEWQTLGNAEVKFATRGSTDLNASYSTNGKELKWAAAPQFTNAQWRRFETTNGWLYRVIEAEREQEVTLIIGARRPLTVRFNGGVLPGELGPPGWLATQIANINEPVSFNIPLKRGANFLSIRVSEPTDFYFELSPLNAALRKELNERLARDFPAAGEDYYYRLETITPPSSVVLEIGGMTFTKDGTLAICTRRGEIWMASGASGPSAATELRLPERWKLFAAGLQEPLGIWPGKTGEFFIVQRSELTRVADTDGDGRADVFETITAECGVSASQHAYIYGPVRDREGNFWGAISGIGVSGGGKYFGWSFKVTPRDEFIPWSAGLRSPNGICMTPDGELFITDNQGEYTGTCPLHHISKGAFHGHPAALKWDASFPASDKTPIEELAKRRKLPAIQFPYGTMGQSLSEPIVDTTGGKFGPFAGQMLVGDVTKCNVVRVALEKVDGEFQGACFPFRSGFQAGNNRLAFAPDGSLYVGQTDRGWGSIGGHERGLQRLVWTGRAPLEAQTVKLMRDGFEVTFTQPLDTANAGNPANWSLQHFHYLYRAAYGSPQMENTPVAVKSTALSADRKTVRLALAELRAEKIYELRFDKVRGADGAEPLHAVAYYTLNRLTH